NTQYYANSTVMELYVEIYTSSLEISIINSTDQPYLMKGIANKIVYNIENTGDSNIVNLSISFNLPGTIPPTEIIYESYIKKGTSMTIEIVIFIPIDFSGDTGDLELNITGTVLQTFESFESSTPIQMTIINYSITGLLGQIGIGFIILGIVSLWVFTYLRVKKINNKLQEVVEEKPKKTRRRGRYVKVSELEKEKVKKTTDTKEPEKETKVESKKSADLDDLLKEEGLHKDEEKKE
ncbi:MAG: hypothetical protein GY870_16220, partial [archaeon]|nr:hypothetical protein [archaeon]